MIHGRFIINGSDYSPLTINGLGTFMAYSGNGKHRNNPESTHISRQGPIPTGKYYIVDRPTGGWKGIIRTDLHDMYSWPTANPVNKYMWYGLFRDDGLVDDYTWVQSIKRGNFRLHPSGPLGISEGCITLQHLNDFMKIRHVLDTTAKIKLSSGLYTYGTIMVEI